MAFFKKEEEKKEGERREEPKKGSPGVKCNACGETLSPRVIEENLQVCPKCNYHFRIPALKRIQWVVDPGTFIEYDSNLISTDPLGFKDSKEYPHRIKESQEATGQKDAILCGEGMIEGKPAMIGIFEFNFMGGSLESVVGEKIARLVERAIGKRTGGVTFCASGGARIQEGILSLMQMAKTSGALAKLHESRLPYISVYLSPDRSDHGRSFGQYRDAWRHHYGRTEGNDRVCRSNRDQGDDSGGTSRGIPTIGILTEVRNGRLHCGAKGSSAYPCFAVGDAQDRGLIGMIHLWDQTLINIRSTTFMGLKNSE